MHGVADRGKRKSASRDRSFNPKNALATAQTIAKKGSRVCDGALSGRNSNLSPRRQRVIHVYLAICKDGLL